MAKPMARPEASSPKGVREMGLGPPEYKMLVSMQSVPTGIYHHVTALARAMPKMSGSIVVIYPQRLIIAGEMPSRTIEPLFPAACVRSRPDLKSKYSFQILAAICALNTQIRMPTVYTKDSQIGCTVSNCVAPIAAPSTTGLKAAVKVRGRINAKNCERFIECPFFQNVMWIFNS